MLHLKNYKEKRKVAINFLKLAVTESKLPMIPTVAKNKTKVKEISVKTSKMHGT
jgi:hypothetical protein